MKLTPIPATPNNAKQIHVHIEGDHCATVHCDACVTFRSREFTVGQLKTILDIAENFRLFYDNISPFIPNPSSLT